MTNHRSRQAMTKQVCSTSACGMEPRACESQADNVADRRWPRQTNAWRQHSQEDLSGFACHAILVKVTRQSVTNIV